VTPVEEMVEGMLRRDEGERLTVYDDGTGKALVPGMTLVGHPTIGVGRALDRKGISKSEADYLLFGDIIEVEQEAAQFPWFEGLVVPRQAVVLSMIFQLGLAGFKEFTHLIEALQFKNWSRAAAEARASKAYGEAPARWERFAVQLETGVYQP
jgi:lysozyme